MRARSWRSRRWMRKFYPQHLRPWSSSIDHICSYDMYKDIEEMLAAARNMTYTEGDKWKRGLPVDLFKSAWRLGYRVCKQADEILLSQRPNAAKDSWSEPQEALSLGQPKCPLAARLTTPIIRILMPCNRYKDRGPYLRNIQIMPNKHICLPRLLHVTLLSCPMWAESRIWFQRLPPIFMALTSCSFVQSLRVCTH